MTVTSLLFLPTIYAMMLWMPLITFALLGLIAVVAFIVYSKIDNDNLIGIMRKLTKLHDLGLMGLTVTERVTMAIFYAILFTVLYIVFPYDPTYSLFWAIDQRLFGQLFALYLATMIANNYLVASAYNKIRDEVIKRIEEFVQEQQTNNGE